MRAVTVDAGALVWAEHPDPAPGPGQVLVAVEAAGVNAADLLQRQGFYPPPADAPADIPGLELAGRVVARGPGATRFAEGDRVMALVGGGAQAELAVVPEAHAMAVPPRTSFEEAGGFPEAYATAFDALVTQCDLQVGERVLVTGAAGGVGTAAVQLAAAAGARVTASVRDPAMHDAVRALGAHVADEPAAALGHGPFDVVLELVCGPGFAASLEALAVGGRMAVIGVGAGAQAEVNLLALMQRRARVHGSTLRARSHAEKALVVRATEVQAVPLLAAERVRVPLLARFPMAEAEAAYARFAEGGKLGKIVLTRR